MSVAVLAAVKKLKLNYLHQADALKLFIRRIYAPGWRACVCVDVDE